jgi:hypothetical protein
MTDLHLPDPTNANKKNPSGDAMLIPIFLALQTTWETNLRVPYRFGRLLVAKPSSQTAQPGKGSKLMNRRRQTKRLPLLRKRREPKNSLC